MYINKYKSLSSSRQLGVPSKLSTTISQIFDNKFLNYIFSCPSSDVATYPPKFINQNQAIPSLITRNHLFIWTPTES